MRETIAALLLLSLGANTGIGQNAEFTRAMHQSTNRPANVATVINKSLQFLQNTQNPDGSWTSGPKVFINTALVISAFLRTGETITSVKYGETILKAHAWLIAARPESANDRTAIVVALSDYYTLHADTSTAVRVAAILEKTNATIDVIWADILSNTRLPEETQRPQWCSSVKRVQEKYAFTTNNVLPETMDDYLTIYVVGRAKFRSGDKIAFEHYHFLADKVLKRQQDDGSFPAKVEEDKIAATALIILSLADLNHGAYQFHPQKPHKGSESVEQEQEIKVNL